jgi:hypothetical protein
LSCDCDTKEETFEYELNVKNDRVGKESQILGDSGSNRPTPKQ